MGRRIAGGMMALFMVFAMTFNAQAGEVDLLVQKLIEKGILTPSEGAELVAETKQMVEEELKQGSSYAAPKWTQKINVKQDVRLRYQYDERVNTATHRDRARIRYRLGVEAEIIDGFKAGAGLASGSSDPRSTNQTLENTFETPDIRLDYAYGEYGMDLWEDSKLKVIGGKYGRGDYFWTPTDLLWDSDINPNGASLNHTWKINSKNKLFQNAGIWVMDEISASEDDPYMYYYQGGLGYDPGSSGGIYAKAAGSYYGFKGVQGRLLDNTASTNTLSGGVLLYDYDSIVGSGEIGWNAAKESSAIIKNFGVFGDIVQNLDDNAAEDSGWMLGFKFGDKKISGKGQWQFKYMFGELDKDAWLDTFPDSDRYSGGTDMESQEIILEYGLHKNVILGLDVYFNDRMLAATNEETLVQLDLNFKF